MKNERVSQGHHADAINSILTQSFTATVCGTCDHLYHEPDGCADVIEIGKLLYFCGCDKPTVKP